MYKTSLYTIWSHFNTVNTCLITQNGHIIDHPCHYNDVTMSAMASQITGLTIIYSTVYSDADQRKHQSSVSLASMRGIHRWPVNSPHKGPVTRKMFPFDDVIMRMRSGDRLNIKMSSEHYRDSHYKDKTVVRPSYLYNGNPCLERQSLYWNKALFSVVAFKVLFIWNSMLYWTMLWQEPTLLVNTWTMLWQKLTLFVNI